MVARRGRIVVEPYARGGGAEGVPVKSIVLHAFSDLFELLPLVTSSVVQRELQDSFRQR